jgi:hypothetical protein
MPGQKHMIRVGVTLDEVTPGLRACLWVDVGGAVPVGTRQLDRVMNRVTCDQGFAATAPNPETRMTRAMPRQWRECEVVIEVLLDAGVRIDEIDEASLYEREDAFAKGRACRIPLKKSWVWRGLGWGRGLDVGDVFCFCLRPVVGRGGVRRPAFPEGC